ncbi:THO complex subunit 7 [Cichlidogyrus casuarinus]|uniref:THO complex subunit 7 n=1 Tax=Cichlidogyrus casuarinus TaxID=1844966 RepID=A0ABD2PR37_9PLAT
MEMEGIQCSNLTNVYIVILDKVIKHKLLIEGESGSDDKRITTLLKGYFQSCQALLNIIQQCENAMKQSVLIAKMNLIEFEEYNKIHKSIETDIESMLKKVQNCKQQLISAKNIRKNRQEYDTIAREIDKNPDRATSEKAISIMEKKLEMLKDSDANFDRYIELRKKQFHLLFFAAKSLQNLLENESVELPDLETELEEQQGNQMDTN